MYRNLDSLSFHGKAELAVTALRTGTGLAVALEVLDQRRIAPVARMVIAAVRVALPDLHLHAGNRPAPVVLHDATPSGDYPVGEATTPADPDPIGR